MPFFAVVRSFAVLLAVAFLVPFQGPAGGPQANQCFVAVDTAATDGVASIQYLQVDKVTHSVVPFMIYMPVAGSYTWPGDPVVAGATPARANSPLVTAVPSLAGYRSYYIGADSKLYDINFAHDHWHQSAIMPPVTCSDVSCLAAGTFVTAAGAPTPSLFFISSKNFVNYTLETGANVWSDPKEIPLGPSPRTGTPLLTANLSPNHETDVFFIGDDNQIHEYSFHNGDWSSSAVDTNALACRNPSPLVGVPGTRDYTLYYFGENNRIYSLIFTNNKWKSNYLDKDMRASASSAIGIDASTGDLVYEDSEYRLHLLHKDGDTWKNSVVLLPSQFEPDYGTPLALCKGYVFYKSNDIVVEFRIVKG
jgi:hypothetical protein